MVNLSNVLGVARAEMRLTRRVLRFWIFAAIAALVSLASYGWFLFIHWSYSAGSASAASANPRFFIGSFGSNFIFFFLFGLLFLGFDLRARDRRERMAEVLDALPVRNLELVLGKFVGILVPAWVIAVVIAIIMSVTSAALDAPFEPRSVIAYLVFMAIPAYTFFLALVFFLAATVRHRLLVALVAVSLLVLLWAATQWWVPLYSFSLLDITGGFVAPWPSDVIPKLIDTYALVQRFGFLLMGLGLLWLATATHPRKDDDSRGKLAAVGGVLLLAGAALCTAQVVQGKTDIDRKESWIAAHEAQRDAPAPDLRAVTGEVDIRPGSRVDLDLELRFSAREGERLEAAVFTLNPGIEVQQITDPSGGSLDFTQDGSGLFTVPLGAAIDEETEQSIRIVAGGMPDDRFAYLDAVLDPWELSGSEAVVLLLGYTSMVFESRYVALPPGTRWLPASGTEAGRSDSRGRPSDFHEIDLTVEVPEGWLIAGPGRRHEQPASDDGRTRFRFQPGAPVPDVGLVAGRFESRSTEVDGVLLEMLVTPAHAGTFDIFDDAAVEIRSWLEEKLTEAADFGLGYPYDALTMVEVPNELRGFGGGWRMDSTLIQPAMILMRESGFPTARFSHGFRNPERFRDRDGGLPRYKRELLEAFFENDLNGGNPFVAAARSFFGHVTAGRGAEALPLDFVFESLASRLVTEHRGYFSYRIFDQNFGQDFALAGQQMGNPDRVGETYNDVLIHMLTSRPQVWEAVLDVSLVDLDPWEDPERSIDVLTLKGGAMARSMLDDLGREKTGQVLGALRERSAGGSYVRDDVIAAGEAAGEELEDWLGLWIDQTELPGFTVGRVRYDRISDTDDGLPRYQVLVALRNEEPAPGLVRLNYRVGEGRSPLEHTDPVQVAANGTVEIGLVASEPLSMLRVDPYLALNRDPFKVRLPPLDDERVVEAEPFTGSREVEWEETADPTIVVDDLDEGFTVERPEGRSMLRVAGKGTTKEATDRGLPIAQPGVPDARWSRQNSVNAWGRYRHTFAQAAAGGGDRRAVFTTMIPHAGEWEIEYHLPTSSEQRRRPTGTWSMKIIDSANSRDVSFRADDSDPGWNSLGTFTVAPGEARVEVSNSVDDGKYVIADAVRWVPLADPS